MKKFLSNNSAFSLLEVLIALSILAITITAILGTQSGHLRLSQRGEYMSTAVMLAREKLADTELNYRYGNLPNDDVEEIKKIEEQPFGEEYPGFGYELTIKKVEIPIPKGIFGGDDTENGNQQLANSSGYISQILSQAIREVRLKILWESAAGEDQIEIVTHLVDLNANVGIQ